MFVIVFPQLFLVLYWDMANTYGSVISFSTGIILRLLCGDSLMGIPAIISFGTVYGKEGSCPTDTDKLAACTGPVPFRLIVTIISIVSIIIAVFGFIASFVLSPVFLACKDFLIRFRFLKPWFCLHTFSSHISYPGGPYLIQLWSLHSVCQEVVVSKL